MTCWRGAIQDIVKSLSSPNDGFVVSSTFRKFRSRICVERRVAGDAVLVEDLERGECAMFRGRDERWGRMSL